MHRLNKGKDLLKRRGRVNGEMISHLSLKMFRIPTPPNQKLSIYKKDFMTNELAQQIKTPASKA